MNEIASKMEIFKYLPIILSEIPNFSKEETGQLQLFLVILHLPSCLIFFIANAHLHTDEHCWSKAPWKKPQQYSFSTYL